MKSYTLKRMSRGRSRKRKGWVPSFLLGTDGGRARVLASGKNPTSRIRGVDAIVDVGVAFEEVTYGVISGCGRGEKRWAWFREVIAVGAKSAPPAVALEVKVRNCYVLNCT
jgi:hypothetical protein